MSVGTKANYPLEKMGEPMSRVEGGPFSGCAAELNGKQDVRTPYAKTGELNISGPDAQVSILANAP